MAQVPEPTRCPTCGGPIDPDYRAAYQASADTLTGEIFVSTQLRTTAPDPATVAAMRGLADAVDEFLNGLPDDECSFWQCEYDPDSVTPADGHSEDCPIRKLSEAYRALLGSAATEEGG